jgi:hypothetical protein
MKHTFRIHTVVYVDRGIITFCMPFMDRDEAQNKLMELKKEHHYNENEDTSDIILTDHSLNIT